MEPDTAIEDILSQLVSWASCKNKAPGGKYSIPTTDGCFYVACSFSHQAQLATHMPKGDYLDREKLERLYPEAARGIIEWQKARSAKGDDAKEQS